jgi:GNAT superfamily N-acetyltransferase
LKSTTIRKLEAKDLDFAYKMVSTEEWNDREADLRRMLNCEPEGCFIAEVDDEPAGHVFSIGYEKLGWIGLLIVDANHRNKGIATMLMERAMDYLLGHGLETIKLEAVPEVVRLYRKLGFVDEYDSLRFVGTSRKQATLKSQCTNINRTEDLLEIGRFDAEYFGADRTKVLSRLCKEFPELCLVSRSKSGVNGYIMCREAAVGYKLGPWVCKPKNRPEATMLLTACLSKTKQGEKVYIGVPALNTTAVEILHELDFQQCSESIRMRCGKELHDCIDGIFAIGGPMKG